MTLFSSTFRITCYAHQREVTIFILGSILPEAMRLAADVELPRRVALPVGILAELPLLGVLVALALSVDVPAEVVLLQRVLVDLRVGVDVAADVLLLLGVLVDLGVRADVTVVVVPDLGILRRAPPIPLLKELAWDTSK